MANVLITGCSSDLGLAGEDAKAVAGLYTQLGFEDYEQAIRQTLDWEVS